MSIGDVFSKAFELWKKDVLWLILAALVVGLVIGVIAAIMFAIIFGVALGGVGLGFSSGSDSINGIGAGMLVLAFIGYVVGLFVIMVLAMTFYGGMFEMVIGAARENRPVVFGDLFSGFKKFGSYAIFALVMAGIVIALSLLNIIPLLGTLVMIVALIWIEVIWLYVLPLIADQGISVRRGTGPQPRDGEGRRLVEDVRHAHPADGRHLGRRPGHRPALVGARQSVGERRRDRRRPPLHRLRSRRRTLRDLLHQRRCIWAPAESSRPSPAAARPTPPVGGTYAAPPAPPAPPEAPVTPVAPAAGPAAPVTPTRPPRRPRRSHPRHAGPDDGDRGGTCGDRAGRDGRHGGRGSAADAAPEARPRRARHPPPPQLS